MGDRLLAAAVALTLAGAPSAHAGTLSFFFSFSNVTGSVPGTVTGEITGLADNSLTSATNVFIDSFPSALGLSLTTPFDTIGDSAINNFTVSNGQITAASYFAVGVGSYTFGINRINGNFLAGPGGLSGPGGEVFNGNGFAGVTFTAVPTVPEPATWAMMLLGFAGLGFAFRQSRRKVSFA
jgi:hypothetical protein